MYLGWTDDNKRQCISKLLFLCFVLTKSIIQKPSLKEVWQGWAKKCCKNFIKLRIFIFLTFIQSEVNDEVKKKKIIFRANSVTIFNNHPDKFQLNNLSVKKNGLWTHDFFVHGGFFWMENKFHSNSRFHSFQIYSKFKVFHLSVN